MEHKILAALHIGAACYRNHLERLCKTEAGDWKAATPEVLELELEINAEGFEELFFDDLLAYRQTLYVARDYVADTQDVAFKRGVLLHIERSCEVGKRRAAEITSDGRIKDAELRAVRKIVTEIADLSKALHESAP